jgi:uncharacterized protein
MSTTVKVKYLLDVNVLLAAIWQGHAQHQEAIAWLAGKSVILCPIAELGFLRISTNRRALNAPMEKARDLLERFASERNAQRIADDLPALQSHADKSEEVTDSYLAALAHKHGARLASFDTGIKHAAVEVIK